MARAEGSSLTRQALLAGLILPLLLGLGATLRLADPAALALPGLGRAMGLSLFPGLAASLLATGFAALLLALPRPRLLDRALPLLLALPHAAFALGLMLFLAPSGPWARLLAPVLGWQDPPRIALTGDPNGLALLLALVLKETPFLLALGLAAHGPEIAKRGLVAATLGYGRLARFLLVEWPALYPRLRLPILATLAYGLTPLELALVLGPSQPAPLAVEILRQATRPDLGGGGIAAGLGVIQLGLLILAFAIWRGAEILGAKALARLRARGWRGRGIDLPAGRLAWGVGLGLIGFPAAITALLAAQSLILRWPFGGVPIWGWPDPGPLWGLALPSLALGLLTSLIALVLCLPALEAKPNRAEALIFLPLLLPQVTLLPALAGFVLPLRLGPWTATLLAHLAYVLPYVWLTLAGPWRAWNPRLSEAAQSLGAGPLARIGLKAGGLRPVLALALALGLAVSGGQYLATLLFSGGRLATLTTEAMALATGPDRARIALLALAQSLLPALAFLLAGRVKAFPSAPQAPKDGPKPGKR
jgi:putative thiamine transport system permease protein